MTAEKTDLEQNEHITTNGISFLPKVSNEDQTIELNNRIKNDFMSYCFSFLNEDEEAHQCVQIVWNKYLQCVGDVAMVKRQNSFLL
jgi:hypothetical protein